MSLNKATLIEVATIADEVRAMTATILAEIEEQTTLGEYTPGKGWDRVKAHKGPAPASATHGGYSKITAALKRRSMDLTRALAELRRSAP